MTDWTPLRLARTSVLLPFSICMARLLRAFRDLGVAVRADSNSISSEAKSGFRAMVRSAQPVSSKATTPQRRRVTTANSDDGGDRAGVVDACCLLYVPGATSSNPGGGGGGGGDVRVGICAMAVDVTAAGAAAPSGTSWATSMQKPMLQTTKPKVSTTHK